MDGELVEWDSYDPVPMTRAVRKEQTRIQQESALRRLRDDAAARDAEFRIVREEALARGRALLRSKGSHDLLDYGASRTRQRSQGGPHLEELQRVYDETGVRIDQGIAYDTYGPGRR
jgi:hypothetical protein